VLVCACSQLHSATFRERSTCTASNDGVVYCVVCRLCYAPSHSEGELTRLSWNAFAAYCRYLQGLQCEALGFQVPARDFCTKATHLLNRAASPRQMLSADTLLTSAIRDLQFLIENPKSTSPLAADDKTVACETSSASASPTAKIAKVRQQNQDIRDKISLDNQSRRRMTMTKLQTPSPGGGKVRSPGQVESRGTSRIHVLATGVR